MTKQEIIEAFIEKGILSGKSGLIRRPFCWRKRFDAISQGIFAEFAKAYRSEEEAWFCLCRNIELPMCPICGKHKVKFTGITKNGAKGFNTTCDDCSANAVPEKVNRIKESQRRRTPEQRAESERKRRATNLARYGSENVMTYGSDGFKQMMVERFGDPYRILVEKRRQTCLTRYGAPTNLLLAAAREKAEKNSWSPECRARRIAKSLKLYGVESPNSIKEVQRKMQQTKREKIAQIETENDCTLLATVSKRYGIGYKRLGLEYIRIGKRVFVQNKDIPTIEEYWREGTHTNNYTSRPEKEVAEYVRSIYDGEILENCTSAVPNGNHRFYELDIYLPTLGVAIDFDGTYWHSIKFKDIEYHARKTAYCRKVGIELLHVFEDGWRSRRSEYESVIKACIDGTFVNAISVGQDGTIVGDNSLPILCDHETLSISEPHEHVDGKSVYYDCGTIAYKRKGLRKWKKQV